MIPLASVMNMPCCDSNAAAAMRSSDSASNETAHIRIHTKQYWWMIRNRDNGMAGMNVYGMAVLRFNSNRPAGILPGFKTSVHSTFNFTSNVSRNDQIQ